MNATAEFQSSLLSNSVSIYRAPKVAEAFKSKLKQLVDSQKHNIIVQKLLNPVNNTQGTSSQTDGGAEKQGYSGKGPERKVKHRKSAHIC